MMIFTYDIADDSDSSYNHSRLIRNRSRVSTDARVEDGRGLANQTYSATRSSQTLQCLTGATVALGELMGERQTPSHRVWVRRLSEIFSTEL